MGSVCRNEMFKVSLASINKSVLLNITPRDMKAVHNSEKWRLTTSEVIDGERWTQIDINLELFLLNLPPSPCSTLLLCRINTQKKPATNRHSFTWGTSLYVLKAQRAQFHVKNVSLWSRRRCWINICVYISKTTTSWDVMLKHKEFYIFHEAGLWLTSLSASRMRDITPAPDQALMFFLIAFEWRQEVYS